MSAVPKNLENQRSSSEKSTLEVLEARATKEFILGLMGAVGCGLPWVVTEFESELRSLEYEVVRIKISDFIKKQIDLGKASFGPDDSNRYLQYQTAGNELRGKHGNDVMAKFAINQINRHRLSRDSGTADLSAEPPRVAYLIDQIKHPAEIQLLRTVYRNTFYLVGVMSLEENRKSRLRSEGIGKADIDSIIKRDRKEAPSSGQQLEKAFKLADYFMHHPLGEDAKVSQQIKRFLDLTHGSNIITPTAHEHAMYVAYSTAMKSSCMSRQVGASITDVNGRIIAVGTNDVPRYKGGLYAVEHSNDDRCFKNRGVCENNAEKRRRKEKIRNGIVAQLSNMIKADHEIHKEENIDKFVELVYEESGIPDLIEFSRAVHAEMDALISLTRGGGGSTVGSTLYATTFPCHNCARHIIAAGVEKVYYIEPYEKSLAPTSHDDAIVVLDHEDEQRGDKLSPFERLRFIHFSGVGPRMYPELFMKESRKDDDGNLIRHARLSEGVPIKVIKEYIDSYRSFEAKVASSFEDEFSPQVRLIE